MEGLRRKVIHEMFIQIRDLFPNVSADFITENVRQSELQVARQHAESQREYLQAAKEALKQLKYRIRMSQQPLSSNTQHHPQVTQRNAVEQRQPPLQMYQQRQEVQQQVQPQTHFEQQHLLSQQRYLYQHQHQQQPSAVLAASNQQHSSQQQLAQHQHPQNHILQATHSASHAVVSQQAGIHQSGNAQPSHQLMNSLNLSAVENTQSIQGQQLLEIFFERFPTEVKEKIATLQVLKQQAEKLISSTIINSKLKAAIEKILSVVSLRRLFRSQEIPTMNEVNKAEEDLRKILKVVYLSLMPPFL